MADAMTCARVSNQNMSSIFFCNYVCLPLPPSWPLSFKFWSLTKDQNDFAINTECSALADIASNITQACTIGDHYVHGQSVEKKVDAKESFSYEVIIGGEDLWTLSVLWFLVLHLLATLTGNCEYSRVICAKSKGEVLTFIFTSCEVIHKALSF